MIRLRIELYKYIRFTYKIANTEDRQNDLPVLCQKIKNYLCAGFSGAGAGAGASGAFSGAGVGAGAGAGASAAGFGASGFGCSAGLQPIVNATSNINDNTKAMSFFIKFSPPSNKLI
jgi:hypothetical protein